jgi:hypothetical protein
MSKKKKLTHDQIIDKLRNDKDYYGDYGAKWMSNSDIKNLQEDTFKQFKGRPEDSENLVKGRYFHQSILEPEKIIDFPIWKDTEIRGKAYKEYLAEHGLAYMLKESEAEEIKEMIVNFLSRNEQLTKLITHNDAEYEVPMVGEIFGHEFKAKADIISEGIVIDLKTSSANTIQKFIYDGRNRYFYDTQAFIYQTLFKKPMTFVAVDKNRRYYNNTKEYYWEIYVCPASEETVLQGKQKVEMALQLYEKYYGENKIDDIKQVIYNSKF